MKYWLFNGRFYIYLKVGAERIRTPDRSGRREVRNGMCCFVKVKVASESREHQWVGVAQGVCVCVFVCLFVF